MITRYPWETSRVLIAVSLFAVYLPSAQSVEPLPAKDLGLVLGPDTTVITSPLDRYGYPDYIQAIDDTISRNVSKEENFWVLMWPAIGNAENSSEEYLAAVEKRLGITISRHRRLRWLNDLTDHGNPTKQEEAYKRQNKAIEQPWTRKQLPDIARWIDANEQVLEEIRLASLRPKAYAPLIILEKDGHLFASILLPHVQAQRAAARLLASRANLRLAEGDSDGAFEDILTCFRIAKHTDSGFTIIESLVARAIRIMAMTPLTNWLSQTDLSEQELARRWSQLQQLLKDRPFAVLIDKSERYMFLDIIIALLSHRISRGELQSIFGLSSGHAADGSFSLDFSSLLPDSQDVLLQLIVRGSDLNETLRQSNKLYDGLVQKMTVGTYLQRKAAIQKYEQQLRRDGFLIHGGWALAKTYFFSPSETSKTLPAKILFSQFSVAIFTLSKIEARSTANARLIDAAFRLRTHLARTDTLPRDLESVSSLGSPLIDPFDGQPLKLKRDARGIVLYSIGFNEMDNHGFTYGEENEADDIRLILHLTP